METGRPVELGPRVVRVLAPNPSPMTYHGTNSYLLGQEALAVIDPGPDDARHLDALLRAIGGRPVSHVFVTHSHLDHSPLAGPLARAVGAPVLAFGDWTAGRRPVMERLAAEGLVGGGEGVDTAFRPDVALADGAVVETGAGPVRVLHTPGHLGNHVCLGWDDVVFTGDHVMGWASSLVSPPDGDLTAFMESCDRLAHMPARTFYPGHGDPVREPAARLDWLIGHRRAREAQVLAALQQGPAPLPDLTTRVYADIDPALHPAAARNLLAHLIDLYERGLVTARPQLSQRAIFTLA
ncbi:MAG: MBL fold metallo-hydrolase [Limimaricola sp.]|uniref:MBL fold metallo-hydrolase n=1 Tax=Limimaricola sp. TaxID=2211665 RepID=UPI001DC6DB44|nr:MBL fold metallo-hydrolase [Limimaricola sp.]MBI1418193.1 MBL fold metallo-hydrolase [Limimaricola sp.]